MTIHEDILTKFMAEPITKIVSEPGQEDITILKSKLVVNAAKIKTTHDMVEKGRKYGFLVTVIGKNKYGIIIGNMGVQWTSPEDPCCYNKSITQGFILQPKQKQENACSKS